MNTTLETPPVKVQITFEYLGQERTLNKHDDVQAAVKAGTMTEAQARTYPWFLRIRNGGERLRFKLVADDTAAIKQAKDHLKAKGTTEFSEFLKERAAKRACTLKELDIEWRKEGLPDSAGHPRKIETADSLKMFLDKALKWWGEKSPAMVTPVMMRAYATARRNECREKGRGTGDRSVDVELGALSCLCDWALSVGKISANPFNPRPTFQRANDISHCHEFAPDSDEQWHQILRWFFTFEYNRKAKRPGKGEKLAVQDAEYTLRLRICGAWLAFTGLTGIRPEEPQFLYRFQELSETPGNPSKLAPGTVFVTRTGEKKMRVQRGKNGQNPFVTITPVLQDFLDHWTRWLASTLPTENLKLETRFARALFPDPTDQTKSIYDNGDFTPLIRRLTDACDALKISRMKPKGFGRAYYVRVRRSQGMDDSIIASELGQTTNGKLIRDTYGNPDDMAGGALFDWLPEIKVGQTCRSAGVPAWHLLTEQTATNVIAGKF